MHFYKALLVDAVLGLFALVRISPPSARRDEVLSMMKKRAETIFPRELFGNLTNVLEEELAGQDKPSTHHPTVYLTPSTLLSGSVGNPSVSLSLLRQPPLYSPTRRPRLGRVRTGGLSSTMRDLRAVCCHNTGSRLKRSDYFKNTCHGVSVGSWS